MFSLSYWLQEKDEYGIHVHILIFIHILGTSLCYIEPDTVTCLSNNTVLITDTFGQIPTLQCISGSLQPNVGHWIAPSGENITYSALDPFSVDVGDSNDPGYLEIVAERALGFADQGVYTCQIPDETGRNTLLRIGVYLPAYICKFSILA